MKYTKNGKFKKAIALMLSFMLLVPSVAFADETQYTLENAEETEVVQIDLTEAFTEEFCLENGLEDIAMTTEEEFIVTTDDLIEDGDLTVDVEMTESVTESDILGDMASEENELDSIEDATEIVMEETRDNLESTDEDFSLEEKDMETPPDVSLLAVSMPATRLNIMTATGKVGERKVVETINCGENTHIANDASATLQNAFNRDKLILSIRYTGYHFAGQDQTVTGDVDLTNSSPYNNTIDSSGAATAFTIDWILTPRDPDIKQTVFEFAYLPYYADGQSYYQEKAYRRVTINWNEGEKPAGPTTPELIIDSSNTEQYLLIGIDSTMEYRKGTESTWTDCPDGQVTFPIPEENDVVHVRYKAEQSRTKELPLRAKAAAPNVGYTIAQQEVSVTDDMEYCVDDGTYADVTDEMLSDGDISAVIDAVPAGGSSVLKFRYKATETTPPSLETSIVLYPRAATPTNLSFDYATYKLTHNSSSLQYKIIAGDNETKWTNFSTKPYAFANLIYDNLDTTILIRTRAVKNTNSASLPVTFVVPKKVAGCETVALDLASETLVGFEAGKTYQKRTGTSTTWSNITITNGAYSIASAISTSKAVDFYVREAANGSVPPSAEKLIVLPMRPAKPTGITAAYNVAGNIDKPYVTGISETQEYSYMNQTSWQDGTGEPVVLTLPTSNSTLYVREKATDTDFASSILSMTIYTNGTAPSASYSSATELLSSVTAAMEYDLGNGYVDGTGAAIDLSSLIDNLTSTKTISIRKKVTETRPSSKIKTVTLYPRAAKPTGVAFDAATSTLTGFSSKLQYKIGEDGSWKTSSKSSIDLSSYVSTTEDVNLYVRTKYTSTASSSKPIQFVIPKAV